MRKLFALGASILLLLNFSYALADANKSKPTKNPDNIAAEMDGKSNSDKGSSDKGKNKQKHDKNRHGNDDHDKSGHNKGNQQSQEMRDRRDERKEIQEEYRANREPGQEANKVDGKPEKKSWYKFWE